MQGRAEAGPWRGDGGGGQSLYSWLFLPASHWDLLGPLPSLCGRVLDWLKCEHLASVGSAYYRAWCLVVLNTCLFIE